MNGYGVTLVLGNIDRNVASYTTKEFRFNPVTQEKIDTMRGLLILSVTMIIIMIIIVIVIILSMLLIPGIFFGIIFRRFFRKNKKNKE